MPHELIYTSTPRGLKAGATGYCTVAHTPDLPKDLADQLEGVSHFRHLRVGPDPAKTGNPVAFSHSVLTSGYTVHHVLSRVADSGLDHSGRSNFLAHHIAFDPDHLPEAGPAWLCEQRLFYQKWDRGAGLLPADRDIPSGQAEARVCTKWMQLAGDAGWGGVLATATNAAEPAYLVYEPGQDVLGLLAESMALLTPEARWNVTFNTYFTGKAVRTTCQWRCVTADSAEAREAIAGRRGVVLRIDQPMSGVPSGPLVEAARTGEVDRPAPKRRTPAAAPVRAPRQVEVEDLPEPQPEPIVPASRPIRTRPVEPESEDSSYEMPLPARPRAASGRSGTGPLILGLLLGGLLLLAFTSLVELAAGKSLLGFAGVKNADAEQAKKEKETAESEAATRLTDMRKERDAAENAKAGLREQLRERERDLTRIGGELEKLKTELDAMKNAPPPAPVVRGGGFFMTARDRMREVARQQELTDAQAKAAELEKEIVALKTKLANAGNGPIATAIPVVRLDKVQLAGQNTAELFKLKMPANAKPKLDVFGLPPDIKSTPLGDGDRVLLKSQDTGFEATIGVKDGTVRVEKGENMDKHPFLGLAVIRVNPGTGDPPAYRQLFWPSAAPSAGLRAELPKGAATDGRTRKYVFKYDTRLGILKPEVDLLKGANQLTGRGARIGIGARIFDLEPGSTPFAIENRAADGDPGIKLTIDGGEAIIEVNYPDVKDIPEFVRVDALEVVRPVPEDKERSFPGYAQELIRLSPR